MLRGWQALTEDRSAYIDDPCRGAEFLVPSAAEAHPVTFNEVQCVLCSLETATVTGLFITAKLFAAFLSAGPLSACVSCMLWLLCSLGLCNAY